MYHGEVSGSAISDVVVVGAGPAGCWTARTLARLGARVTIVDGSHPREKPCGGGVTGRALALVGNAIDQTLLPRADIRTARFVDSSRHHSAAVPLGDGDLVVTSRTDFDSALFAAADAAGARIVRARVTEISRDGRAFALTTSAGELRARTLVGAD